MPRPVIDNDLDEIGPSLDELKTAVRRKLDRMQPDERETALRQLEGDPNFSGVVDEYRYPTPGAWTEEAFKPATPPAPRKPSFWQRVSPFPIRPESQLGRAGITTLPEAVKALWRKQQREAEIEATTPAPQWLQWAPKARKEGPVMWSDITFPSWMAAGVIPAFAGVTGPGKMGKVPKKVVPKVRPTEVPARKALIAERDRLEDLLIAARKERPQYPDIPTDPEWRKLSQQLTDVNLQIAQLPEPSVIPTGKRGAVGPFGKVVDTWKNTRVELESAAPPELKSVVTQRFLDWEQAYRKAHQLPGVMGATEARVKGQTAIERWWLKFNQDFAKEKEQFVANLYKDYPDLAAKVKPPVRRLTLAEQDFITQQKQVAEHEARLAARTEPPVFEVGDTLKVMGDERVVKKVEIDPNGERFYRVEGLNQRVNERQVSLPGVTPPAAKELQEMTKAEWLADAERRSRAEGFGWSKEGEKGAASLHKRTVENAVFQGIPVPPEVLADYPDLAAKAEARAKVAPEAVAPPIARQNLGRLEKGDIIEFKSGGGSYEIVGAKGRQVELRDIAGKSLTISSDTPVIRIAGSWREAQDLAIQRYLPPERPPRALGPELVAPGVAKEPWQMTREELVIDRENLVGRLREEARRLSSSEYRKIEIRLSEVNKALRGLPEPAPVAPKPFELGQRVRDLDEGRYGFIVGKTPEGHYKVLLEGATGERTIPSRWLEVAEPKPVPPEVLAEYPDLAAKVKPPVEAEVFEAALEAKYPGKAVQFYGEEGNWIRGEALDEVTGKTITVRATTKAEAQSLLDAELAKGKPPVTPAAAKEPWRMKIGKTRTKEGVTAEAEVDWSGKKIIWFRDEESMANPSIVNHEVAHIAIEDLPDAQLERLLDDYAKLKAPGWKAEGYEAEWIVKNKFHQEEIAIDYGQYLTDASQLKSEIKAFFDKELPSSEVLAKYPELAVKGKPLVTEIPKVEAVLFQEGVDNLHRVATDEVVSPQLRLEQPAGARLWPSEEQDIEKLIRKPPPPPTGLPSELPGAKYPGPPTRLPGIPEKKPPPPPTGLPERLPGAKYPGPPTGLPPIPPGYFESFASTYGPKPKYTPPIETLIARGKEFTGDEVGFQYAMRGAQEAAPKMGAVGAKVNWLRAIADPVRRLNPDVRIAWQAASAYSREQAERVQELLVGISGALEQAFGKDTLVSGARPFRDLYRGKPSEALKPIIGSVRDVLERPSEYKNLTSLQRRTAKEWEVITNAELGFSQRMGVDIGEVEGIWMGHWFKDPEKARQAFSKRGLVSPAFKKREHTLEEFGQIAQDFKLEMEDDVLKIAARRLNGTAKARTNQIFLKSVAAKLGGYPLKPGAKTPIGYQAIQSGGKFWVFPENVADDVGRILRPLAEPADEAMVGQAIDAARNVLLNLDFSIGGARQGLLGFVGNPLGAVKAYQEAWQVLRQPEGMAIHLAMNAPEYELAARHGLVLNMSPLDISIGLKGMPKPWLDKVPVMGAWNNFQFNTLMRPLKLAVWKGNYATLKSVRDGKGLSGVAQRFPILGQAVKKFGGRIFKMTDDELMDAAAEAANNWVGGIDWSRIMPGERPSTMRRAILLTEGWTRANVGAFVNLPKLSAQGLMARRLLMQELVILIGVTTAVNVASTGDLPTFDPRSMDFGVINVGPFKIRIIPHGSYVRAFARMIGGEPEKGWARNKSEVKERIDAVWNLVEGRFGQPIRVVTDLARGKDYYGRDIDNKALYMARQGMPIVAQTVLEDMKRDTGVTLAERSVTEFIGFTTYGKPGSQRLLEMAQRKGVMLGIESWDDLQPWQQAQIQMMPEARDIMRRNMSQDTLKRWNIRWNAYDMQVKRDAELKAGKIKGSDWKEAYYQGQSELAARLDQFDKDFQRMRYNPETPEDKALSGYYDTMDKAKSETGVFDGDKWEGLRRDYMRTLSPELQKYVEDNIGIYDTRQASIFRGLRKRLQPYWDIEDQIWAVFGAQAQEMKDRARLIDILATTDEASAKAALTPAITEALKVITEEKKEWKEANPGLADMLRKYYSY